MRRVLFLLIAIGWCASLSAQTRDGNGATHVICDSGCGSGGVGASVDISSVAGNIIVGANVPTTVASGSITFTNTSLAVTNAGIFAVQLASVPSHDVTNAGTFAVQATLAAETTKVIGTVNQGTSPWTVNLITGFSLAATQTDRSQKTQLTDGTRDGTIKAASTLPLLTDTAIVTTQRDPLPAGTNLVGKVGIDQTTPGTTNRVDVGVFPDNEPFNVAQINGVTPSLNVGLVDTGTLRTNLGYTTAGPTAFNSTAAGISISVTGKYQVGFFWSNAAFTGTINFQASSDGGSTWDTETCIRQDTLAQVSSIAYVANTSTLAVTCIVSGPMTDLRINNTAVSAGTSTQRALANYVISPFAMGLSLGINALASPTFKTVIAGTDESSNALGLRTRTTAMTATTDPGLVVRSYMPTNGTQAMPTMDAVARPGFQEITDGVDAALVTTDGSLQAEPPRTNYVAFSGQESVAAGVADTWYIRRQWALPASAHFIPSAAWAQITTALTKTLVGVANSLGTLNLSTNAFAAVNSVASPFFYGRLFGCVTTVLSATPDTVTPTYTDELGNSQAAAGVVFAASLPVGNCMEFPLNAATPASTLDTGVRAVTTATDNAATTGVITFYGVNPLADFAGTAANQTETATLPQVPELNTNEQIVILMRQAAVTAQLKTFGIGGSLR